MAAAGVEYGLRVTRGRNRTDEGVLSTMRALLDAGADINARMLTEPQGESAAHLLVIEQRLSDYQLRLSRPAGAERARDAASHGAARRRDEGLHADREVPRRERRGPLREGRERPHGARSRDGNYNEPFLRQAAEPHAETAAVLKELMAAQPPAEQGSATAAAR